MTLLPLCPTPLKSITCVRLWLPLVIAAFATAPLSAEELAIRYEASHNAMGTVFTVVAYGRDPRYLAQVANEAFEEIDRLDAQMSNYRPESELEGINRRAAHEAVVVEPKLFHLIRDALRYSEETGGAFDITVGPLVKAWGFFRGQGRLPRQSELTEAMKRVGCRHVKLDPAARALRFDAEGVELDLGGIAKGYAVDQVVEILRANGVSSALVSSGTSSLYALGAPPAERGWKVTLRDPYEAEKVGDVLYLKNYSLSASGNYEKFFKLDGKTYCHIMDPRDGRPVEDMLATAVLAPRAVESDALSTAFFVLGVKGSRKYLASHPDLVVLFYQPTPAKGRFKRVFLQSASFSPSPETLAEFAR
jgi:thiamine biosynthesis lipoprotein